LLGRGHVYGVGVAALVLPRALMKSTGALVQIDGTHSKVLRSELGVLIAVSPFVPHHHLTLRLVENGGEVEPPQASGKTGAVQCT
jgi:hypothetical protein